ncbi:MAG: ornithine cyclodeaminase family protein [Thermomicrobiales bacterium]
MPARGSRDCRFPPGGTSQPQPSRGTTVRKELIIARVLCLSASDVDAVLDLETCIPAVERAFASYATGGSQVYPVVREQLPDIGGIFGIKSGYYRDRGWLGLKAGGFWADNRRSGLAAHQSVILLFDPATGVLAGLVDANVITRLRTGAVGALAARYLSPPQARRAAVIGCGAQGEIQTRALAWALPDLAEIRCFDLSEPSADAYIEATTDLTPPIHRASSVAEAVDGADVVVTTTPSWEPLVQDEYVGAGAHISAIGADTRGKQELDAALFRRARVVVDDWEQAREIGESQHAHRLGWLRDEDVFAELGEIAAGRKEGRGSYSGLTIFDATGIALQDLGAAGLAVERAREREIGTLIDV